MIFLFPMMGRSSRFVAAGYKKPKYQLTLFGRPVFDWAVYGFKKYFTDSLFIFVHRDEVGVHNFIKERLQKLGVINFQLVALKGETLGQADSVLICLSKLMLNYVDEGLTIFNIDSFRPKFTIPDKISDVDGYLEVFEGDGDSWSFALLDINNPNRVIRTSEKKRISNLCSSGLYYFRSVNIFYKYAQKSKQSETWKNYEKEFYIAPLYNSLIEDNLFIGSQVISKNQIMFCGIPNEFEFLVRLNENIFTDLF